MTQKNILTSEAGFTLIEIIAVLVIMGILAAVAVPKFFDLQTRAREKAVYTAVAELKVRVNQHFASELLNGKTVGAITYTAAEVGLDIGDDFDVPSSDWDASGDPIRFNVIYPKDPTQNPQTYSRTIAKPKGG
jgi:prepilin-type N-terminal cleavage/methylation domain-containing protein